ncbi:MAG: tRNA (guanosine(46)-N7)-methyltransferase TrmB [Gammaproteobacteria bacterium]|nr:tRNA (guanosine(46)-N7)-methyltransferase TrmB [Gammaproteobacteria bacterium]
MSKAQAQGYANLPEYRLAPKDIREFFTAETEIVFVEIGFGNGEVIAQIATQNPTWQCLGIDVYRPGIGALVNRCERAELRNVRIVEDEATTVLALIPDHRIDLLYVLFPDPWPKQRHHRRRLVNAEFAALAHRKISASGIVYIATDAGDYAKQIQNTMIDLFYRIDIDQIEPIPQSRYRQKALAAGVSIWDFAYKQDRTEAQKAKL